MAAKYLQISIPQKLKNFLTRFLIYHLTLLWLTLKFYNLEKSSTEFKEKVYKNLNYFGLQYSFIDTVFEEPVIIHFVFLLVELIFAIMGLFGSFTGGFVAGSLYLFYTLLYFNPFIPEYRIPLNILEMRSDLFYAIGVLLAFFVATYYPYPTESSYHRVEEPDDEEGAEKVEDLNIANYNKNPHNNKMNKKGKKHNK